MIIGYRRWRALAGRDVGATAAWAEPGAKAQSRPRCCRSRGRSAAAVVPLAMVGLATGRGGLGRRRRLKLPAPAQGLRPGHGRIIRHRPPRTRIARGLSPRICETITGCGPAAGSESAAARRRATKPESGGGLRDQLGAGPDAGPCAALAVALRRGQGWAVRGAAVRRATRGLSEPPVALNWLWSRLVSLARPDRGGARRRPVCGAGRGCLKLARRRGAARCAPDPPPAAVLLHPQSGVKHTSLRLWASPDSEASGIS